jgi:hypothetical protein
MTTDLKDFTMREARADDRDRLERLAALDSRRVPSGRMLLGELDGELVAAVPLGGGPAIADPFKSTSAFVSLLGLRAAQLRGFEQRRASRAEAAAPAHVGRTARRRAWPQVTPMPRVRWG